MLLTMALATAALPLEMPRTCGNHDAVGVMSSFLQTFHQGKAKEIAAMFAPTGVWRMRGRTLIGGEQIGVFLRDLRKSEMTIELLGTNASFFSKEGWSLTGPFVEHKIGAPLSRRDAMETYSVRAHCQGSAWRIEEFQTPADR